LANAPIASPEESLESLFERVELSKSLVAGLREAGFLEVVDIQNRDDADLRKAGLNGFQISRLRRFLANYLFPSSAPIPPALTSHTNKSSPGTRKKSSEKASPKATRNSPQKTDVKFEEFMDFISATKKDLKKLRENGIDTLKILNLTPDSRLEAIGFKKSNIAHLRSNLIDFL